MSDKAAEPGSADSDKTVAPAESVPPVVADEATVKAPHGESSAESAESAETAESAESGERAESVAQGSAAVQRPDTPDNAGTARPRPSALRNPLVVGLAVAVLLLIGAVGVAGYLFVQERNTARTLAAQDEARQAACQYAPVLANYDAKNLDPYFSAVLAGATGDWKTEFETTTSELREALVAGQVVSRAGEIQCAVKSADTASAEVVVVIGQTISSLGTQGQPAPGQLAMVMRMEKADGDRWLVNQMITPLAPGARQ